MDQKCCWGKEQKMRISDFWGTSERYMALSESWHWVMEGNEASFMPKFSES
jgi:hypothetical protein